MNEDLFERLLNEEEGTSLDFKQEQYRFDGATEHEKSELLKDILGFANAWRRSDAYILIGVEEARGGRSIVIGIAREDQFDDANLQQFVNSKTNRPIRFDYKAFAFEDKQVGVIHIEEQPRPFHLTKNYGNLKKNEVYVRRGSSTTPPKPASPDEIARMGDAAGAESADLHVEFADADRDESLGTTTSWQAEYCKMPPAEDIPNLTTPMYRMVGVRFAMPLDPTNRPNKDYYRSLAEWESARKFFHRVRLVVTNAGRVAARSVLVELTIPCNMGTLILSAADLPRLPTRQFDPFRHSAVRNIRPIIRQPGELSIDKNNDRFRIEINCDDLQPGRQVRSDTLCIGMAASGDLAMNGKVFAANLSRPKDFVLRASVTIAETEMSLDDLVGLPEPQEAE